MKTLGISLLFIVAGSFASESRADGLILKLPPDGSWVRYDLTAVVAEQPRAGISGTLTLRSVGRETVQEKPCRWIEVETRTALPNMKGKLSVVYKLLIPEEHLGKGKSPLEHIARGWTRLGPQVPRPLIDTGTSRQGMLPDFLPGRLTAVKTLKKKRIVRYQQGNLNCFGSMAETKLDSVQLVYSTWPHKKVPFGVAASTVRAAGGKINITFELILNGMGTGAKSALPDRR